MELEMQGQTGQFPGAATVGNPLGGIQDRELTSYRVRYQVTSASALNFVTESQKLIELIKQYGTD